MVDVAVKFTDGTVVKAENVEIEIGMTSLRIIESEDEYSVIPLVNVQYFDVKESF